MSLVISVAHAIRKQIKASIMYLFRRIDALLTSMGIFGDKQVDPFMTRIQLSGLSCITHCKLLLDTLLSSRYTFDEHFGNKQVQCMQIVSF